MLIKNKPIVILANYRTGSSVFARKIALEHNIPCFPEPTITEERKEDFLKHYTTTKEYVVKFMPDQIDTFAPYRELIDSNCYKIKIIRKNTAEQIASYYIAKIRDKWWTTEEEAETNYFVPIDKEILNQSVEQILTVNQMLASYTEVDEEIVYEDLGILTGLDRKISMKPANLKQLLNIIERKI
jgi:hypothetical protein